MDDEEANEEQDAGMHRVTRPAKAHHRLPAPDFPFDTPLGQE